ncbi:hypothetical protein COCOBI_18-1530 [Coccomyxa sp. Obi]|nr:hypothetical protein COCOBI_18-1530 [Coccomyxa sp. Obi]
MLPKQCMFPARLTIVVAIYILQRLYGTQVEWDYKSRYTVVLIGERVVPAYFLWLRPDLFIQHRTLIISVLHVAHMISGDAFGSFWPAEADFSQPLQFYTMAFVSAGNMLNLLFWGLFDITPSTWHLGLQLLHTAKGLHEAPKRMERLQVPVPHHSFEELGKQKSSHVSAAPWWLVGAFPPPLYLGHPPGSLYSAWAQQLRLVRFNHVLVGLVLPCSYVYSCQLQSRRLWRRAELKRDEERRSTDGNESAAKFGAGMKLLPVWKLYLPHMVIALIAATVSGQDPKLLHLMF